MTRPDPALVRLATRVLWPGFAGTTAPDWLRRAIDDDLPGAVYFAGNIDPGDPDGVRRLSETLSGGRASLLLGIDEEGGDITRLEAGTGSTLPGAAQLGLRDDPDVTRAVGAEIARRVRRAGATIVLGPVADVNTDPRNPIIGVRSFGSDPALVSRHVAASVRGLADGGVLSCAKHFPGHGDTRLDSHTGLPVVTRAVAEIEAAHLPPFRAAVEAGVDAVMTSHIVFSHYGERPATVNPRILALVRRFGFEGLIVSDALDMAAISATMGMGRGAVAALAAGADLLCLGNPPTGGGLHDDEGRFAIVRAAVVAALADGSLPLERVEQAARRVETALATVAARAVDAAAPRPAVTRAHLEAVVVDALRITGPLPARLGRVLVIDARRRATGAVGRRAEPFAPALGARRVSVGCDEGAATIAAQAVRMAGADSVIVLVDALTHDDGQRAVIDAVRAGDAAAIVVDVGVPGIVAPPAIHTGGANRLTAETVARLLARDGRR